MNKKTKYLYIPLLTFTIVVWFYGLVFSSFTNILENTKVMFQTNSNVYLDSKNLNQNYVIYVSDIDLSRYKLYSSCTDKTKFIKREKNMYVFKIEDFSENCLDSNIFLKSRLWRIYRNTKISFNLFKKPKIMATYLDYSDNSLKELKKDFNYKAKSSWINKNLFWAASFVQKIYMSRVAFEKQELMYKIKIIDEILEARKSKYILPIANSKLPKRPDKVPNFWRWYRAHYTDWIHHGWDIDSPLATPILAIDDWIIVRIVKDWKWEDFENIKYGKKLTETQKAINLDILRWNQIWLKTMKWEVVFYSHIDNIPEEIKKGDFIKKWTFVWKIWITWVPDKSYNDYHSHFPIQSNPYIISKAWKNVYLDYIMWDWKTKWKTPEYVLKNQHLFFEE